MDDTLQRATTIRLTRAVFVGSLVAPIVCAYLLVISDHSGWVHVLLLLLGLAIAGHVAIVALARRGNSVTWFLSVAALNVLLLTPELVLRQAQFRHDAGIQFGYPRPSEFEILVPDEELFWRLAPGRPDVNSLGFRGREIERPKPAQVYRVLFLGDSVPYQGYPALVETFLNGPGRGPRRFASVNLAVPGYSTYQGRRVVARYAEMLEPDLAVISYGWNDHWQAYGAVDSRKTIAVDRSAAGRAMRTLYEHSRLVQWLRWMLAPLLGREQPLSVVRVPRDEYEANLIDIGSFFAARRVPVIFITPPTAHYALGVPDYLVTEGFAASKERVTALHREYNQIVRDVAAAHGWLSLDLERELAGLDSLPELFGRDGIHLTRAGSALVARRIADFIAAHGPPRSRETGIGGGARAGASGG